MHRGVHFLSTQATTAFEEARRKVAALIGAPSEEVVFTKNATEALNLVAYSWALANLTPGDEVRLPQSQVKQLELSLLSCRARCWGLPSSVRSEVRCSGAGRSCMSRITTALHSTPPD